MVSRLRGACGDRGRDRRSRALQGRLLLSLFGIYAAMTWELCCIYAAKSITAKKVATILLRLRCYLA